MTPDPLLGKQLANFRLDRVLGRGGMAQVYYGWDVKLQRPVAVKVIDARLRGNPAYAQRFVREAQAVAAWRHENIAQVYYADEEAGLYYFAMEYLDGMDLSQLLAQYAAQGELMPHADVLQIGRAVASALDYAHQKGVIHRDVKPSNVMVTRDDRVVLSDFGLALDVQQGSLGEVFGTAHYIAPEQARRSSEAVPQSDLYSLGVMLYEMLTGVVPFDDPSPTAVALQHITQPPPPPRRFNPGLSAAAEAVLLKALSKSPADRYPTGSALLAALEDALRAGPPAASLPALPPPPAGMAPPPQPLSRATVADVVAAHAPPPPAAAAPRPAATPPPAVRASRTATRPGMQTALIGGLGAMFVCAALAAVAAVFWMSQPGGFFAPATTPQHTPPVEATSTPPPVAPTGVTEAAPAPTGVTEAAPQPTVKYPGGKRFVLYYDENSFYLLNASESIIDIPYVILERLLDGDVAVNRFTGSRWWKYYPTSKPTWCMAVKIHASPAYLDPPECGHDNVYLSVLFPARDDPGIFWTPQTGSHQFRVLWKGSGQEEEVARCEIAAQTCEVFFP